MPQKRVEFDGIIHEFPDDFTDDEIAAALGGGDEPAAAPAATPAMTPGVLAGLGAMKAAPAIVKGVNMAAKGAGAYGGLVPAVLAYQATEAVTGNKKLAGGVATAAAVAPKIASVVQNATNPTVAAVRGAAGRFVTGSRAAGPVMRGAGWLSRMANVAAVPATILSTMMDARTAMLNAIKDPNTSEEARQQYLDFLNSGAGN